MKIYWMPNLRHKFEFEVKTPEVARGCLNAIATFDLTLPKIVVCNVGGCLAMDEELGWFEWEDADGEDIFNSELVVPADDSVNECLSAYQVHLRKCGLLARSQRQLKTAQEGDSEALLADRT